MKERVLITGGTGYIGSKLAVHLQGSGYGVVVLSRREAVDSAGGVKSIRHDGSVASISEALRLAQPDLVIHLAANYVREHNSADVPELVQGNITFGAVVVESMTLHGCRRLIYAGSAFQRSATPAGGPRNLYAATKNAFEEILNYYEAANAIDTIRMTLGDVYGEDDPRPRVLNAVVVAGLAGTALRVPRHDPYLIPIHVDDVTHAFQTALSLAHVKDRFWVGPADAVKLSEIIALVSRVVGSTVKVERADLPALPGDTLAPVPGAFLPDWLPSIILEEGIRRMIKFHRESGDHQQ